MRTIIRTKEAIPMKKYRAECIGTATLVILGCGTAMLVGCDAAAGSGYLLTALALAGYVGVLCFLGADGLRRGYGFCLLFGRYMLVMYGYKLFDILVQDQMLVISGKYFVKFYPETRDCRSWDDRSFNTKNQLIRLFTFPFVCALMAWFTLLIGK